MRRSRTVTHYLGVVLASALVIAWIVPAPISTAQQPDQGGQSHPTQQAEVAPDAESDLQAPSTQLSDAEQAALHVRHMENREKATDQVDNNPRGDPGRGPGAEPEASAEAGTKTDLGTEAEFHGTPSAFVIGRNNLNTRANSVGSTLAEPAAINDGPHVFYTGNTHAEYSTNGGSSYTAVTIPGGPADAPNACCDLDVVYDAGRGVTLWSVLYLNSAGTNGAVRIFVRRTVPGGNNCSYTIDPAGTANNIVPDYPHLGLSNDFLYLTSNNLTNGTSWAGAQVRRFNLDQLVDCVTTGTNTFTYTGTVGQRVFVPVEGARETMYWGSEETTTSFRIFSWPESTTTVSSIVRALGNTSNHVNPDCRGGVGNFDFIERSTAWSITGFRLRGAVGANRLSFYWNVGPDASHTQGHVHSAVFRENDGVLIAQPHIFNNAFCFGYPVVSADDRGDLGLSIAAGGRAGGGGTAAQGYVGIDDDYTSGVGFFGTVVLTAAGTHNRTDSRYGDYMTVRRQVPCGLAWSATSYALNNGTATTNVNARYVEFVRGRDNKCYTGWRNDVRAP